MYENINDMAPFIFSTGLLAVLAAYAWFTANAKPATKDVITKETAPE
jgi:hypothetical protein